MGAFKFGRGGGGITPHFLKSTSKMFSNFSLELSTAVID